MGVVGAEDGGLELTRRQRNLSGRVEGCVSFGKGREIIPSRHSGGCKGEAAICKGTDVIQTKAIYLESHSLHCFNPLHIPSSHANTIPSFWNTFLKTRLLPTLWSEFVSLEQL
jgi:hypothetical protein